MYLKTISIAASFLIATIFENQSYLVLLLIVAGFFLYWHLFHYLSIQKERNFLKEENQYFIDSFQSIRNPITLVHVPLRTICNDNCPENYNPQIQISAESETKRSIFREKDKTKRSKKESAQHSKSRNKSFVMTSVSAL